MGRSYCGGRALPLDASEALSGRVRESPAHSVAVITEAGDDE